jgi:hypothetical protein
MEQKESMRIGDRAIIDDRDLDEQEPDIEEQHDQPTTRVYEVPLGAEERLFPQAGKKISRHSDPNSRIEVEVPLRNNEHNLELNTTLSGTDQNGGEGVLIREKNGITIPSVDFDIMPQHYIEPSQE